MGSLFQTSKRRPGFFFFLLDRGIFVHRRLWCVKLSLQKNITGLSHRAHTSLLSYVLGVDMLLCPAIVISNFIAESWLARPSLAMPFTAIIHTGPSKVAIGHTPNLL